MSQKYILIRPDEDGNPARLLTPMGVDILMDDPIGSWGVKKFEDEKFLTDHPNPHYWPEGTAVLLKAEVIVPKAVTAKWLLP